MEEIPSRDALLARVRRHQNSVGAVLVGPQGEKPIHLAHQLRAIDDDLAVLIVCTPTQFDRWQVATKIAPAFGDGVGCYSVTDGEALQKALTDAATSSQRRGHSGPGACTGDGDEPMMAPSTISEADFDGVIASIGEGVLKVSRDGRIMHSNTEAGRILGRAPRHLNGVAVGDVIRGLAWESVLASVGEKSATGNVHEAKANGAENERVLVRAASPFPNGSLYLFLTSAHATDNRATNAHGTRMQSDLLSMISHDIRAPLGVILGALNELASSEIGALNDEQSFLLGLIRRSGERLMRLAANILFLARMESGRLELSVRRTDLATLVRRVVDDMQKLEDAGQIAVIVDVPHEPLEAMVDTDRVAQVVTNLVVNAVRFARREVHVTLSSDGDAIALKVDDDGPGISADALASIFDGFRRIEAPGKKSGTGLGLAVVRAIVEAHGGSVRAENRLKSSGDLAGARFVVDLPRGPTNAA